MFCLQTKYRLILLINTTCALFKCYMVVCVEHCLGGQRAGTLFALFFIENNEIEEYLLLESDAQGLKDLPIPPD